MKGAHSSISRLHSSVRPLSRYLGVRIATTEDERMTKKKRENETKASGVFFSSFSSSPFVEFRRFSSFVCWVRVCVVPSVCLIFLFWFFFSVWILLFSEELPEELIGGRDEWPPIYFRQTVGHPRRTAQVDVSIGLTWPSTNGEPPATDESVRPTFGRRFSRPKVSFVVCCFFFLSRLSLSFFLFLRLAGFCFNDISLSLSLSLSPRRLPRFSVTRHFHVCLNSFPHGNVSFFFFFVRCGTRAFTTWGSSFPSFFIIPSFMVLFWIESCLKVIWLPQVL